MTQVYIAKVVEIIKVNDIPTLELRIRVPSIHGLSGNKGIPDDKLPIARPVMLPGSLVKQDELLSQIESVNKVVVIFEDNNLSKPIYLGVVNSYDKYEVPMVELNVQSEHLLKKVSWDGESGTLVIE